MLHQVTLEPITATYLTDMFFLRVTGVHDGGPVRLQKNRTLPTVHDLVSTVGDSSCVFSDGSVQKKEPTELPLIKK